MQLDVCVRTVHWRAVLLQIGNLSWFSVFHLIKNIKHARDRKFNKVYARHKVSE